MNNYVLGHSPQELERLSFQAQVLRPITTRLLLAAGLTKGMRVLDLGCGTGDVSMLAATIVGASGNILGIDRSQEAVELATHRASLAGLKQTRFQKCDIHDFSEPPLFDCVIGRYVMLHQADPAAFLRKSAGLVKPGGVLALHEILLSRPLIESHPEIPMLSRAGDWIFTALQAGILHHGSAARMIEYFVEAGLPQPELFCERPVGGGKDSLLYRWTSETLRSIYPHLIRMNLAKPETEHLDTFESRLRTQALKSHAQLLGPTQIAAWLRIDGRDSS